MLYSSKIIMISMIICKLFSRPSSSQHHTDPVKGAPPPRLHDSVIADSRIKDSVIRASSSNFGWYGSTRTIFMNKIGGVPRWVMLPIGGAAIIIVLICTCYRAAQEVDENTEDLETVHVDEDYVNYDGDIEETFVVDLQRNSISNFLAKRPSETRV